jgi:hypothetical protein
MNFQNIYSCQSFGSVSKNGKRKTEKIDEDNSRRLVTGNWCAIPLHIWMRIQIMRLWKVHTEYKGDGGFLESNDQVIALGEILVIVYRVEVNFEETSVCRCCA